MAKKLSEMSKDELLKRKQLLERKAELEAKSSSNYGSSDVLTGAVGAAGAGAAVGAGKYFLGPGMKARGIEKQIARDFQKPLGIEGTEPSFVPREIKNRIDLAQQETSLTKSQLREQLTTLDNKVINQTVDSLANKVKKELPNVMKGASEQYSAMLSRADQLAQEQGFVLTNRQFVDEVVNPSIDALKKQGASDKAIKQLYSIKKQLAPRVTSAERKIGISEARSMISKVTGEDPFSPTASVVRKNFHNFLEVNSPDTLKPHFATMNNQYKEFSQIRNTVIGSSDRGGVYDTKKIRGILRKYVKAPDGGTAKLMKSLGEGSGMVKRIEGVSQDFSKLRDLSNVRHGIQEQLKTVDVSSKSKVLGLTKQRTAAEQLVSKASQARAVGAARSPGGLVRRALGMGGRGLMRAALPLSMTSEAIRAFEDQRRLNTDPAEERQRILNEFINNPVGSQFGIGRGGMI